MNNTRNITADDVVVTSRVVSPRPLEENATTAAPGGDDGDGIFAPTRSTDALLISGFVVILLLVAFRCLMIHWCTQRERTAQAAEENEQDTTRKEFISEHLTSFTWVSPNHLHVGSGNGDDDEPSSDASACSSSSPEAGIRKQDDGDAGGSVDFSIRNKCDNDDDDDDNDTHVTTSSRSTATASSPECAICLSKFETGQVVGESNDSAKCSHQFHLECIENWLLKHDDCPLCRELFLVPASSSTHPSSA